VIVAYTQCLRFKVIESITSPVNDRQALDFSILSVQNFFARSARKQINLIKCSIPKRAIRLVIFKEDRIGGRARVTIDEESVL